MVLAPTPCREAGCRGYAVEKGACSEHITKAFAGHNRKQRYPKDWRTRRLIVLKRDKGVCYLCGKGNADGVDHVVANDDNSLDNLKAVHHAVAPYCHRYKTAQEGINAMRGNRIKRRF
jgi:5-methylcytosine-specific restriction endonuclease McrA